MWQGLTGFVRAFVTAVTASANAVVDSSTGSITLAFAQACTGVALWLQAQIAQVILLTRAATSSGAALDSFFADWFFTRLGAAQASGQATFSRFTPTLQALVPVGSLITSGVGLQQYVVTTDTTNAAYSATLNGYVLPPTVSSVTAPISAVTSGVVGNAPANTITSFIRPITGVDLVTNPYPLTNGSDAESDGSFRARFWDYLQSLSKGTVAAIRYAVMSMQIGMTCTILENTKVDLTTDNGFLTVVVDDGTGTPPSTVQNAAGTQVYNTRAAGIRFVVIPPTVVSAIVAFTIVSADTTKHAADIAAAQTAVLAYINSLPVGSNLIWAKVFQVAFNSSANIEAITGLLINGVATDLVATAIQRIMSTSVTPS